MADADEVARFETRLAQCVAQVLARVFRNRLQVAREQGAVLLVGVAGSVVEQQRALVHHQVVVAVVAAVEEAQVRARASGGDPPLVRRVFARNKDNSSCGALSISIYR